MKNQSINIDIKNTEEIFCKNCGNNRFIQVYYIRKVSAVIAGQESLIPIPVFECTQCGQVMEESIPAGLK